MQLEHQGVQWLVQCAVCDVQCARCIVPELISFDDLRDKFLPPGRGPARPITEIESEFQRLAA